MESWNALWAAIVSARLSVSAMARWTTRGLRRQRVS